MIAALFALAAAMIIAGAAAVVQGFPYVRLESGMAMVVGGTVAASSGAVLLGLCAVAGRLKRIERALSFAGRTEPAPAPPISVAPVVPAPVLPGAVLPGSGAHLPPVLPPIPVPPGPPVEAERGRIEPLLTAEEAAPSATPVVEPELPLPGLTPPARESAGAAMPGAIEPAQIDPAPGEPERGIAPEDDLFAAPAAPPERPVEPALAESAVMEPTVAGDAPAEPPALRSSLDAEPGPVGEADPAEPAAKARTVVGRYASGSNTYVMFEDGSIEADTPQGRFTFASLDELKGFVDGGGEVATRGAA